MVQLEESISQWFWGKTYQVNLFSIYYILYAYIWHEARLSATHILFTLNWTQPTCSWCTSLQWSLGFSSFPHFLHFLHLTWLPLWVNFFTKIVTAAPRELEGMQENPGQESRFKARRRRQRPLQIWSLCLSKEKLKKSRLVMTNFVQWMTLYQLECALSILKISVAEWLQINKHWTTDWQVTRFPKGIEVSSLLSIYKMASGTCIAAWVTNTTSCCLHHFSLPVKGEANQNHAVGQRMTSHEWPCSSKACGRITWCMPQQSAISKYTDICTCLNPH